MIADGTYPPCEVLLRGLLVSERFHQIGELVADCAVTSPKGLTDGARLEPLWWKGFEQISESKSPLYRGVASAAHIQHRLNSCLPNCDAAQDQDGEQRAHVWQAGHTARRFWSGRKENRSPGGTT